MYGYIGKLKLKFKEKVFVPDAEERGVQGYFVMLSIGDSSSP